MTDSEIKSYVQSQISASQKNALYSTKNAASHTHNGIDSPKLPNASVAASGPGTNTTVSASFTPTLIPIASASFAYGIAWVSGGGFTILTAGQYLVIGFVFFNNPTTADVSYQTMIYQNAVKVAASYSVPHATGISVGTPASIILNCVAGDSIQLYAQTGSGSTQTVTAASSYLSIGKI